MNLIDAIKSGRPYRRPGWSMWRLSLHKMNRVENYGERLEDLLADDWEIEEPTVTITWSQFWKAVETTERLFWPDPAAKELARHLGLEAPF